MNDPDFPRRCLGWLTILTWLPALLPSYVEAGETARLVPESTFDPVVARYYEDASSGVLLSSYASIIESNNPTPYELKTPEGILVPLRGQKDTVFDNLHLVTRRGEDFLKVERNSGGCLNLEWGVAQFQNVSSNYCFPEFQVEQLGAEKLTEWVGQPALRDADDQGGAGPSDLTSSMVTFRVTSSTGDHFLIGAKIDWQSISLIRLYREKAGRNTCDIYNLGSEALLTRVCEDCDTADACSMELLKLGSDSATNMGALPDNVLDINSRPIERVRGEHWIGAVLAGQTESRPGSGEPGELIASTEPGLVRISIKSDKFTVDAFGIGGGASSRIISLTRDVLGRLVFIIDQSDGCSRVGRWQPDIDKRVSGPRWLSDCTVTDDVSTSEIGAWDGRGRPRLLLTDPGGTTWMYVEKPDNGRFVPILIGDSSSFPLYVPRFFPDGSTSSFVLHSLESLGFDTQPLTMEVDKHTGEVLLRQDRQLYECSGGFCLKRGRDGSAVGSQSLLEYSSMDLATSAPIGPFTVARDTQTIERSERSRQAREWSITCERMRQNLSGSPTAAVACTRLSKSDKLESHREPDESLVLSLPSGCTPASPEPFVYIDRKYALWVGCAAKAADGRTVVSSKEVWVVPSVNGPLGSLIHIESSLTGFGGWQSPFDGEGRWQPNFREVSLEIKKSWATEVLGDASWHMTQLQFPRRIWVNTLGTTQLTTVWSNGESSYVESTKRSITPLQLQIGLTGAVGIAFAAVVVLGTREHRRRRNIEERWKRERMLERLYVNPIYASRFPTPGPPVRGSIRTRLSIDASILEFLFQLRPANSPLGILVLTGSVRTGKTSTVYAAIEVVQSYQLPGRAWVGALVQGNPPGQALDQYVQRLALNLGIIPPSPLTARRRGKLIDDIVLKLSGRTEKWEVIIAIDEWNQWLAEGSGSSRQQRAEWRALIDRLERVACVRVVVLGPGITTGGQLNAPEKWTEMFGAYDLNVLSLDRCSVQEVLEMLGRGFKEEGIRINDLRSLAEHVHTYAGQNIWIANRICLGLSQHLRMTHPLDGNVQIEEALEALNQRIGVL